MFVHIIRCSTLNVFFPNRGTYFQIKWDEPKNVPSAIKEHSSEMFTGIYSTINLEIGSVICSV